MLLCGVFQTFPAKANITTLPLPAYLARISVGTDKNIFVICEFYLFLFFKKDGAFECPLFEPDTQDKFIKARFCWRSYFEGKAEDRSLP